MKIKQDLLIEKLLELTNDAIVSVKKIKELSSEKLNEKTNSWSILECMEHLNLYGNFYLPEIERRLLNADLTQRTHYFKSSLVGDYFVRQVKAENTKKLKSTKMMDSTGAKLSSTTIDQFIKQLERLSSLLQDSKKVDLNKVKTNISLTKLFRLRLGDTLRFLVHHNERHIKQAEKIAEAKITD